MSPLGRSLDAFSSIALTLASAPSLLADLLKRVCLNSLLKRRIGGASSPQVSSPANWKFLRNFEPSEKNVPQWHRLDTSNQYVVILYKLFQLTKIYLMFYLPISSFKTYLSYVISFLNLMVFSICLEIHMTHRSKVRVIFS